MNKEEQFRNFNWSINLIDSFGNIESSALEEIAISGRKEKWSIPTLYCLRNILFHSGKLFKGTFFCLFTVLILLASLKVMKVDLDEGVDQTEFTNWVLGKIGFGFRCKAVANTLHFCGPTENQ